MIRTQFLIPCFFALLIGLGALAGLSSWQMSETLTATLQGQLKEKAYFLNVTMTEWLRDRRIDVTSWGDNDIYATALDDSFVAKASRKVAEKNVGELVGTYGHLSAVHIVGLDGTAKVTSGGTPPVRIA